MSEKPDTPEARKDLRDVLRVSFMGVTFNLNVTPDVFDVEIKTDVSNFQLKMPVDQLDDDFTKACSETHAKMVRFLGKVTRDEVMFFVLNSSQADKFGFSLNYEETGIRFIIDLFVDGSRLKIHRDFVTWDEVLEDAGALYCLSEIYEFYDVLTKDLPQFVILSNKSAEEADRVVKRFSKYDRG